MLRRDFLSVSSFVFAGAGQAFAQNAKSVLEYGAKPDGRTPATRPLQRAIDDVAAAGGGVAYVPAGTFLTGRLDLKSHVTLHLEAGCTLLGSTDLEDYRGAPGSADASEKHLIYAKDLEDVAITGAGRIDGQGPSFWEPSGRPPVSPEQTWTEVASHALKPKKTGRPSPMVLFANCRGVRVQGVRLENSAGWTLHTLNCDDVRIEGISIKNPINGPNTDGIDMTGCQNVFVTGCSIETGDDAICLKSENSEGPQPRMVRNVVVSNCILTTCCNGFKLGTGSEWGFENIVFSNSVIYSNAGNLGDRVISGIALEVTDGGWIDGLLVSGIQMQRVRTAIFIRLGDRKRVHNDARHGLRRVSIENVQASETLVPSSITGLPGDAVSDVRLSNIWIENALPSRPEWVGRGVPEKERGYPEARMFGMLPVSGLYVRHARNVSLDRMEFVGSAGEARPTVALDDVEGARLTAISSTPVSGAMPVLSLTNARNVWISGCEAPAGTSVYVGVSGSESSNVALTGNNLRGAAKAAVRSGEVPQDALVLSDNLTRER